MSTRSLPPSVRAHRRRVIRAGLGAGAVSAVAVTLFSPSAHAAAPAKAAPPAPVVVASGLNNPRQLAFDSAGRLLIAEAGRGGPNCVGEGEEQTCIGTTGAIRRISRPATRAGVTPETIVSNLLSGGGPDGTFSVGADGVSENAGKVYVAMTYAPPDVIPDPLPGEQLGKLLVARPFHAAKVKADITAVESACPNCDGYRDPRTHMPETESNPYAVLALPGRQLVADAAANDVIEVRNGKARVFAVLPRHGSGTTSRQAVPTSLASGPDGTILVGELAHEEPGAGRVDVLSAGGGYLGFIGKHGTIASVKGGLSTVSGVAYGKGYVYVSQLFAGNPDTPGLVTKIDLKTGAAVSRAVPFPAGIAVDGKGNAFVSAWSVATADGAFGAPNSSGQVWRLHF